MKLNLVKLIPKNWNVENINDDSIIISCKTVGRGNDPRPFILPKNIAVDERFVEGIAVYLGDGKLSNDFHHLDFTGKDVDIVKFVHDFFKDIFGIDKMYYRVSGRRITNTSIRRWADLMGISIDSIKTRESERFRHDCFNFQISGRLFVEIFRKIVKEILNLDYRNNASLRRAFLRGLFAAEGSVNLNKYENYLVYVGYHFSYIKEEKLAAFVQKLLKLEGIESKLKLREDKGERYLQITNWKNYAKCWQIGLFDLCKRKKDTFMWKLGQMQSSRHISDELKLTIA